MKSKNRFAIVAFVAAVSLFSTTSAMALTDTQVTAVNKTIASTPAAELGARSAGLVAKASKADKTDTAVAAVKAVASKHPAAMAAVVSSMVAIHPNGAAQIAAAAAQAVPNQAELIASVATLAAPEKASQIASDVASVTPNSAEKVNQAVAVAVNKASAKSSTRASATRASAANTAKVFPAGSGGNVVQRDDPINQRAYVATGGTFSQNDPEDFSGYAAPDNSGRGN